MTPQELRQWKVFTNRILEVVSDLERERDTWKERYTRLIWELEDLIDSTGGVVSKYFFDKSATWQAVFETGMLQEYHNRRRKNE